MTLISRIGNVEMRLITECASIFIFVVALFNTSSVDSANDPQTWPKPSQSQNPVFVINLDRSTKRLEHVDFQLKKAGMTFTRFSAVDGASFSLAVLERT